MDVYKYPAKVLRVIDGDTAEAVIDLGFRTSLKVILRLFGINAPEVRGETKAAGLAAKARLTELIAGKDVLLDSRQLDKYGRTLAVIYSGEINVNDLLVKEGLAVPYLV